MNTAATRRKAIPALVRNFLGTVANPAVGSSAPAPLRAMTWQGVTVAKYATGYQAILASGRVVEAKTAFGLLRGLLG